MDKLNVCLAKHKQSVLGTKIFFQPRPHRKEIKVLPQGIFSNTLYSVVAGWVIYTLLDFCQQKMISNKFLVPKTEI